MTRTPLFRAVKRALAAADVAAMTRRNVLRASAGMAAAFAAQGLPSNAEGKQAPVQRIAIVGGGAAGLTAAYRLKSQGLKPTVFEAGDRWGGRMLTVPDFYHGMFAEAGGELVDTGHEDLRSLAKELGVGLQPLYEDSTGRHLDLYYFGGKLHNTTDMLHASAQTGAFIPLARQIALDKGELRDTSGDFTARARELDGISLAAYLKQFRGTTEDWAIDLIALAYTVELGLDPAEQSSLNLIDFISVDLNEPFEIYGESDEAFRIRGGSARLIEALVAACEKTCDLRTGAEVTAIARRGKGFELSFGAKSEAFDVVVLALPFTKLREMAGIDALGLNPLKLRAIRELGYGNHMRLICGAVSRVWLTPAAGLPYRSNGAFYADLPFQSVLDSSRAQPGERGLISNFMAGKALPADTASAFNALRDGLSAISPAIGDALDREAAASFAWGANPWSLGSYASAKPGQYTSLLPVAGTAECDGRLHFAGEHTEPTFLGYMNGAVLSGNRAAREVLAQVAP